MSGFFQPGRGLRALGALLLCACIADEPMCEVRVARAALTNAASSAEYLKLERWQLGAAVHVLVAGAPQCSGVLVSARAVLTAKHCVPEELRAAVVVAFGPAQDEREFESTARVVAEHPDRDVMVLELEESPAQVIDVAPLPVARELPSGMAVGSRVQLAGFGGDFGGGGRRGFLVEAVRELSSRRITVSAEGLAGACLGDSGGPLLVRGDDGHVRTLGLLASGSASCFGTDSYTRLDTLIGWLQSEAAIALEPEASLAERDHEALGYEGRCFDNRAVWVEDGRLRATVCQPGRACAWNEKADGYRCFGAGRDACHGLDDLGACENGSANRCERGRLEREPCAACGLSCARSPQTGGPICVAPERDD